MTQSQDVNCKGDAKLNRPAPTIWAQRNDLLFLTFKVEGSKDPKVSFEKDKIVFTGLDHTGGTSFINEIEVFEEIKPEGCVWAKKGLGIECTAQKKSNGYWPRLTKEKAKLHWLKVDFGKWKDEDDSSDDQDGEGENPDISKLMAQMGGGAGMPDMSDLPDVGEEFDSDDEEIPDLEEASEKDNSNENA